jgi:hypothetical protein
MSALSSVFAGLSASLALLLGVAFIYFILLFIGGLMLYYFTGDKPGKFIVRNMMNFLGRLYANMWTYFTSITAIIGISLIFKAVLGSIFPGFAYFASSRGVSGTSQIGEDLRNGLVFAFVSLIIFAAHFGLVYFIENNAQRRGTVLTKAFMGLGLFTTGGIFFLTLFAFVSELVSYFSRSGGSTYPGGSLALLMASFPFWMYYVVRMVLILREERKA